MPLEGLVDLLVPPRCGGCAAPTPPDPLWLCARCRDRVARLLLPDAGWLRPAEGVLAVAPYAYAGPLAAAVRRAKTPGGHALAPTLAALLWAGLRTTPRALGAPVTWVPSVPRRARSRAAQLPRVLAGPGAVALLARRGDPPDQAGLSPDRRRVAPLGTFVARAPAPPRVVLVDDVRTTGTTALAAADALLRAGARRVLVVTLAVGGQDPRLALSRGPWPDPSPTPGGTARSP